MELYFTHDDLGNPTEHGRHYSKTMGVYIDIDQQMIEAWKVVEFKDCIHAIERETLDGKPSYQAYLIGDCN